MKFFIYILICLSLISCFKNDDAEPVAGSTSPPKKIACVAKSLTTAVGIPNGIDLSKLAASCFCAATDTIIKSGDFFSISHWNDSSNINIDGIHYMYISSSTELPTNKIAIYRLKSTDGKNWVQDPAPSGAQLPADMKLLSKTASGWSSGGIETSSVVFFNGQYHMFYTAYNTNAATNFRIGHAVSADGLNWTADTNYLLAPTSTTAGDVTDFNYGIVAEPAAVVFDGKLFLYFAAQGYHSDIDDNDQTAGSQVGSIGVINSSDGMTWSTPVMAFRPQQSIWPRTIAGQNEWISYSTPNAIVLDGKMHVFHDVVNEKVSWNQAAISFASSDDGLTNWTQSANAIYTKSSFDWMRDYTISSDTYLGEIRAPSMYLDGTILHMWFAGTDFGEDIGTPYYSLGIGHATCDLTP